MAVRRPSDADLLGVPGTPKPKKEDPEDVAWALSTAEAMWNRGENADAIKWVRKAAEAASEAQADDRALELAKAAAELASLIKADAPSHEPPPRTLQSHAARPSPPTSVSRPPLAAPSVVPSVRSPPVSPVSQSPARPPPLPPTVAARVPTAKPPVHTPQSGPPSLPRGPTPAPPAAPASARPKVPAPVRSGPPVQQQPALPKVTPSRAGERRMRRSSTNLSEEAKRAAALIAARAGQGQDPDLTKPFAQMPGSPKRVSRRRSRPDPDETSQAPASSEPEEERAPDTDRHGLGAEQPRRMPRPEDMDQWPTESVVDGKELHNPSGYDSGKTRVGAAAYVEASRRVIEAPSVQMRASQAVRVVVWRGPDGVHVAPAGTKISAITIEAILVALDPNVDLATWLKG